MRTLVLSILGATIAASALQTSAAMAAGDPNRGAESFRACAACHSLAPDKNMTGPSLAAVFGRKAGGLESFHRYSPALKSADVVWNEQTLDAWLKDPANFIPKNRMTFRGIKDDKIRADLIAFLEQATVPGHAPPQTAQPGGAMGGGMMGMGSAEVPNLKKLEASDRVAAIRYCRDTYRVTTADGETNDFWERNLRFKTDSSGEGPEKGAPALVGAGMMGDRASVIFAAPEEISALIKHDCGGGQ
jgi:cytochrome c